MHGNIFQIARARYTIFLLATLIAAATGCGGSRPACRSGDQIGATGAGVAHTYYVSPSGSNANPGTREAPWATPGYASRRLSPGDTLVIMGGRYALREYDADIITPPPGTPEAWITIKGEEGNRPVLAGSDDLLAAVDISGAAYLRLENLEIESDGGAPFRTGITGAAGPVKHVIVENLYIHHLDEMGMDLADVEDLQVLDCTITHCGFGAMGGPGGGPGWRDVLVRGCELSHAGHYYRGGPGPGPYDRPDGFGIEPSEGPVEIAYTRAEHNLGDGLDSKALNTYIHHCVVANNACDGIKLWGDGSRVTDTLVYGTGDGVGGPSPWSGLVMEVEDGGTARFEVINVTIHDNPEREAYPLYAQYEGSAPVHLVLRNTIVAGGHGPAYFGDAVRLLADHNLFFRPGEGIQVHANGRDYTPAELRAGELGLGNLCGDPLFAAPAWGAAGDYRLREGSPALDAGSSLEAPLDDLDGNPRPRGGAWDIGAYER